KGVGVRFIEFMPLDAEGTWSMDQVVPAQEIIDRIDAAFPLEPEVAGGDTEPATRYRYRDGLGDVGVIPSVTEPFCDHCDRVRVTAEGKFRTCLFALEEFDLRAIVRSGGSDDDLAAEIGRAFGTRWAGHRIGQVNFVRPARSMSQIGGEPLHPGLVSAPQVPHLDPLGRAPPVDVTSQEAEHPPPAARRRLLLERAPSTPEASRR